MPSPFQVFSFREDDWELKDHKKRKAHKKSRSGCLRCKAKRVKCDQGTPDCHRCQRNNQICIYGSLDQTSAALVVDQQTPGTTLTIPRGPQSSPSGVREYGTSSDFLMNHMEHRGAIFDVPQTHSALPLLKDYPYLRPIILAVSAAHLRHHTPGTDKHLMAEHYQQAIALRSFQGQLAQPIDSRDQDWKDVLILAAMLVNMLVCILPPEEDMSPMTRPQADPYLSWVFSPRPDRLRWLSVLLGLRPLLMVTRPWDGDTNLQEILDASDDEKGTFSRQDWGLDDVPTAWIRIFGLQNDTAPAPLRLLAAVRRLEPTKANMFRYMQFIGRLEPEFRDLLYDRDPKAMWAVGYWMGLVCRFQNLWWLLRRTHRDYVAVTLWLESLHLDKKPEPEGSMWAEMLEDLRDACIWEF
ncbi:hypothetical protein GQ53DRAFT_710744 [Thozetella sp. PMI_491]|nr:hypothetical protein GQ53DRAFT_710744 [Thozetella sp. PMI_491]